MDLNDLAHESANYEYEDIDSGRNDKKPKPAKHKKAKSSGSKAAVKIVAVLGVLAIILGSMFSSVLGKFNYSENTQNEYVDSSALASSGKVINILVLGVDKRSEEQTSSRSDSMMLVSIDRANKAVKMTSFLRDSWVYIPSEGINQRLNAACTYGGYNGVRDTIEYNFGVKIDGYVTADFEMFEVIVDALGGVEVDVSEKEAKEVTNHQKRYGGVTLESGLQNLTGEQALAYCRIRKIDTDFVRTQRQRTVMSAIINKVKKSNPISLYSMAKNAAPYIETSLSKAQLMKAVTSALSCAGTIEQQQVPFEDTWSYATINGNSVIELNIEKNKQKLNDFIYGESE